MGSALEAETTVSRRLTLPRGLLPAPPGREGHPKAPRVGQPRHAAAGQEPRRRAWLPAWAPHTCQTQPPTRRSCGEVSPAAQLRAAGRARRSPPVAAAALREPRGPGADVCGPPPAPRRTADAGGVRAPSSLRGHCGLEKRSGFLAVVWASGDGDRASRRPTRRRGAGRTRGAQAEPEQARGPGGRWSPEA